MSKIMAYRPRIPRKGPYLDHANAAGERSIEPDKIREQLLQNIMTDLKRSRNDLEVRMESAYKDQLGQCALDPGGTHETILHWIVNQVASQIGLDDHLQQESAGLLQDAALLMAEMAMKHDKKLISTTGKGGETALHQAISSRRPEVWELADRMCDLGAKDAKDLIQSAIAKPNSRGENCLHLAIMYGNEIDMKLIGLADKSAFAQSRFSRNLDGKLLADGGNTPLHDAVKYERSLIKKPECGNKGTGHNNCTSCEEKLQTFTYRKYRAVLLVNNLIEKYDAALKAKNASDESPYLYHLQGKKIAAQPATQEIQGRCTSKQSDEASEDILSLLLESAFAIGGFEDACACFFGDQTDENGKTSPLRPGYPIMGFTQKIYGQLIPEDANVLSHVDLQVGGDKTWNTGPQGADTMENNNSSHNMDVMELHKRNEKASISRWEKRMKHLVNIFELIRKRGVKRILKVTIKDNQDRPCSDKVIRECLAPFDVRYLDWDKRDLSTHVVYAVCPNIAELTLYSSGRQAVLDSWCAPTGLCRLKKLSRLNFHAMRGLEQHEDFIAVINRFRTETTQNVWLSRWKLFLQYMKMDAEQELNYFKTEIQNTKEDIATSSQQMSESEGSNQGSDKLRQYEEECHNWDSILQKLKHQLSWIEEKKERLEYDRQNSLILGEGEHKTEALAAAASQLQNSSAHRSATDDAYPWLEASHDDFIQKPKWELAGKLFQHCEVDPPGMDKYVSWRFDIPTVSLDNQPTNTATSSGDAESLQFTTSDISDAIQTNRWLRAVEKFVERNVNEEGDAIKVALIDDGVDISQLDGMVQFPGWPLEGPTSQSPLWCHSETGHGTKMAKMIQRMCPRVHLFVAKLGGKDYIDKNDTAERAAQAIDWAISKKVNIISMSWSLSYNPNNENGISKLERKIKDAADAGILLYCAAADKGAYVDGRKLFPYHADTLRIWVIGSAMESGTQSHFVDKDQVDYLFPGEHIPGMDDRGSSVATAVASGFAALILWCVKCRYPGKMPDQDQMCRIFEDLKHKNTRWVNATRLLGLDEIKSVDQVVEYCMTFRVRG